MLCMMKLHLFFFSICLFGSAIGKKNYCGVCRILVSEVEWLISQVDPKKSIQVGSFRVDPKGNQKTIDKQYARSELHIEEIIESVCEKTKNYAWLAFDDGTGQMVRTVGFNGERLDDIGFNLDREKGRALIYQCDNFLEDHAEELIYLFQNKNIPNYEKLICATELEVCSNQEVSVPLFTLPKASENDGLEDIGDSLPAADDMDKTLDDNELNFDETDSEDYRENDEL